MTIPQIPLRRRPQALVDRARWLRRPRPRELHPPTPLRPQL